MGRKGNWFKTLKKALSPSSKRKKDQKTKLSGKQKHPSVCSTPTLTIANQITQQEKVKSTCEVNEDHCKAHSVPISNSTGMASTAGTQVVQTTTVTQFTRKSREETAAIKIQSVFRGYLARSEIRTLRGLLRLKLLMESSVLNRQAMNTIRCMQVFVRVHSQIRSRRLRKLEENQALQKQLLQKHTKEQENSQVGKGWNDSTQSKEQVEAKLLGKHQAAMRRERALAYAFSRQKIWRNSSRSTNPLFTDPNNPTWGWSWLERWMAAQQWGDASSGNVCGEINKADAQSKQSSEINSPTVSRSGSRRYTFQPLTIHSRRRSVAEANQLKPSSTRKSSVPDDSLQANVQFELSSEANSSTASRSESRRYTFQSFSTSSRQSSVAEPKKSKSSTIKKNSVPEIEGFQLTSKANSLTASRSESHRYTFPSLSTPSPRRSVAEAMKSKQLGARNSTIPDDDSKSLASIKSNNGGPRSSVWDEESQNSSQNLPSYMTFTASARAKSKLHTPFESEKNGAREITSFSSSAKKQLLYPPSPAGSRRYSNRLKVDIAA
ncbi:protein IQ-DOMAIN 1-like [Cucurbita moschata]|uniref:Protein IQ-DOMAIN 1-like n=1 Tax=Cucurbita moschata TaxID=3662 RepID=A0A6J1G6D4_CUCMO|nr:protein IQ-DOMAIN 1-like [Cucurbita moschata]XP_022947294.1 protein IQ-DOMAIN 1-like [Cucurbita moschata]